MLDPELPSRSQETIKSMNLRLERLQQQVAKLEQSHNGFVGEVGRKITQIFQRFGERKAMDQKVQELVDRHNTVIKSFEVRMSHLQKILMEKEAQLLSSQAALNEAKMEIARLKRL